MSCFRAFAAKNAESEPRMNFFFWGGGGGGGGGKWDEVTAPERLESSLNNWFFLREKAYFEFLGESILSSHELKLFFLAIC